MTQQELSLHLFTQEVRNQARHAQLAWAMVEQAIQQKSESDWADKVWCGLQAFATAQANLSKLFFTLNPKQPRADLINAFNNVDLSPLKSRDLRDHFDHWDDRISTWLKTRAGSALGVQDRAIRAESDVGMIPAPDQFRRFDPIAKRLIMRSRDGLNVERFDLMPIVQCVNDIIGAAANSA